MMTMRKRNMRVIVMQSRKTMACSSKSIYHLATMLHPHMYHLEAMQPLQASVKPLTIKKKAF